MPTAVSKSFADLLERLVPDGPPPRAAEAQRRALDKALRSDLGAIQWVPAGSVRTRTNVKGHSPIDLLVVLRGEPVQSSSTAALRWFAGRVADALSSVETAVDSSAVVAPFGPGKANRHRFIPAPLLELGEHGSEVYGIPDGEGGWMRTSPALHDRYLDDRDRRAEATVRPLVRFVKAWKHLNDVPVSSYYLELVTAAHVARHRNLSYTQALAEIVQDLRQRRLAPVNDPACVSGSVDPFKHMFHRVRVLDAVGQGLEHIAAARAAARTNDVDEAIDRWNRFFNGAFPG